MNQTTGKVDSDDKKMKIDQFNLKKTVFDTVRENQYLYIDFKIGLQVQFLIAIIFLFRSPPPLSLGVSYIIYLHLNDLDPPLVGHLSHNLSACPIGHPHRPFVSLGDQGSIIQGTSSHKCCQRVSCKVFNAVVTAFLRYFPASISSCTFIVHILLNRTFWDVTLDNRTLLLTPFFAQLRRYSSSDYLSQPLQSQLAREVQSITFSSLLIYSRTIVPHRIRPKAQYIFGLASPQQPLKTPIFPSYPRRNMGF